jgi:hypothetical protein
MQFLSHFPNEGKGALVVNEVNRLIFYNFLLSILSEVNTYFTVCEMTACMSSFPTISEVDILLFSFTKRRNLNAECISSMSKKIKS